MDHFDVIFQNPSQKISCEKFPVIEIPMFSLWHEIKAPKEQNIKRQFTECSLHQHKTLHASRQDLTCNVWPQILFTRQPHKVDENASFIQNPDILVLFHNEMKHHFVIYSWIKFQLRCEIQSILSVISIRANACHSINLAPLSQHYVVNPRTARITPLTDIPAHLQLQKASKVALFLCGKTAKWTRFKALYRMICGCDIVEAVLNSK